MNNSRSSRGAAMAHCESYVGLLTTRISNRLLQAYAKHVSLGSTESTTQATTQEAVNRVCESRTTKVYVFNGSRVSLGGGDEGIVSDEMPDSDAADRAQVRSLVMLHDARKISDYGYLKTYSISRGFGVSNFNITKVLQPESRFHVTEEEVMETLEFLYEIHDVTLLPPREIRFVNNNSRLNSVRCGTNSYTLIILLLSRSTRLRITRSDRGSREDVLTTRGEYLLFSCDRECLLSLDSETYSPDGDIFIATVLHLEPFSGVLSADARFDDGSAFMVSKNHRFMLPEMLPYRFASRLRSVSFFAVVVIFNRCTGDKSFYVVSNGSAFLGMREDRLSPEVSMNATMLRVDHERLFLRELVYRELTLAPRDVRKAMKLVPLSRTVSERTLNAFVSHPIFRDDEEAERTLCEDRLNLITSIRNEYCESVSACYYVAFLTSHESRSVSIPLSRF
ncbi:hypothetical protein [Eastern grey kangaroopox virus]|uniref:Uncharacterized protein n=1 Tax=Eastern grey kangaroopox virus TaxID=2042482 RepID=A0A2C9DTB3_9POXV|nr:hypothetical protein KM541_gp150 [Eastern grey kangaroopox virus]ATI21246.1 hypothetical protein [Eastern grey kangaroopox virus]ATX75153.1 hypothetical protein EKPV-NSW-ORF166 [Eastern grey kangaroopox virus]